MNNLTGNYNLSNGRQLNYIGGDYFLIYPNGKIELLLEFALIQQKEKSVEIKRSVLIDSGI